MAFRAGVKHTMAYLISTGIAVERLAVESNGEMSLPNESDDTTYLYLRSIPGRPEVGAYRNSGVVFLAVWREDVAPVSSGILVSNVKFVLLVYPDSECCTSLQNFKKTEITFFIE